MLETSVAPDRFFHPRPERAVSDVLGALDALAAPESVARSRGAVTSQELREPDGRPTPDGLWSTQIFGPLRDLRCDCGALWGRAAAGRRCEACGVECVSSSERDRRWAHVPVEGGVLHPALAPCAGELLGVPADDVLALARCEAWIERGRLHRPTDVAGASAVEEVAKRAEHTGRAALRGLLAGVEAGAASDRLAAMGRLPTDLLVDRVPVPPPGRRPTAVRDGGREVPGPMDVALRDVIARSADRSRLATIGAPPAVQVTADRRCQLALEALLGVASGTAVPWPRRAIAADRFRPRGRPAPALFGPDQAGEPTQPMECAFAGADRFLVQFPGAAVVVARATGALAAFHLLPAGLRLLATDPEGRLALWFGGGDGGRFAILDLATGAWADDFVPGFAYGTVEELDEKGLLVNANEGWAAPLSEVVDYVDRWVASPDNRYVWITDKEEHGGIYKVATGELQWDAVREDAEGEGTGVLDGEGRWHPWRDGAADDYFEYEDEPVPAWALRPSSALTLAADARWRLLDAGVVSHDGVSWFRIGFSVGAARFDLGGGTLLVAARAGAALVTVGKRPQLERRFSFDALGEVLADPAASKARPERLAIAVPKGRRRGEA